MGKNKKIKEDDIMATSSFSKNFILDSKKAVDSFTKMIVNPSKSIKIDTNRILIINK